MVWRSVPLIPPARFYIASLLQKHRQQTMTRFGGKCVRIIFHRSASVIGRTHRSMMRRQAAGRLRDHEAGLSAVWTSHRSFIKITCLISKPNSSVKPTRCFFRSRFSYGRKQCNFAPLSGVCHGGRVAFEWTHYSLHVSQSFYLP